MKVKILRTTIADRKRVEAGKVVNVSKEAALELIRLKKAVSVATKAPVVENRDAEVVKELNKK